MSKLLAVAARELRERWLLFPGALVAGLFPLVIPAFGVSRDVAPTAGAVGAALLGVAAAVVIGSSMLARDSSNGRLGFLFSRPAALGDHLGRQVAGRPHPRGLERRPGRDPLDAGLPAGVARRPPRRLLAASVVEDPRGRRSSRWSCCSRSASPTSTARRSAPGRPGWPSISSWSSSRGGPYGATVVPLVSLGIVGIDPLSRWGLLAPLGILAIALLPRERGPGRPAAERTCAGLTSRCPSRSGRSCSACSGSPPPGWRGPGRRAPPTSRCRSRRATRPAAGCMGLAARGAAARRPPDRVDVRALRSPGPARRVVAGTLGGALEFSDDGAFAAQSRGLARRRASAIVAVRPRRPGIPARSRSSSSRARRRPGGSAFDLSPSGAWLSSSTRPARRSIAVPSGRRVATATLPPGWRAAATRFLAEDRVRVWLVPTLDVKTRGGPRPRRW